MALDEILKRFPDWTVDLEHSHLSSSSTTRGWDSLPAAVPRNGGAAKGSPHSTASSNAGQPTSVAPEGGETWQCTLKTPAGPQEMTIKLVREGNTVTGRIDSPMGGEVLSDGKVSGDKLTWTMKVSKPMSIKLSFDVTVDGNQMTGKVKLGLFGSAALSGTRV